MTRNIALLNLVIIAGLLIPVQSRGLSASPSPLHGMTDDLALQLHKLGVAADTVDVPEAPESRQSDAALPILDGTVLRPAAFRYHTSMVMGGQSIDLEVSRTLTTAEIDGRAAWRAVEQLVMPAQFGGMSSVDTFYVDRQTLLPIARSAESMATMKLTYEPNRITGTIRGGGREIPVDVSLQNPVLGDGPGLDLAIAGMDLAPGFETVIRFFDPTQQSVHVMDLAVEGEEEVTVGAGSFETYQIRIAPLDGEGVTQMLHAMKEAPHFIVRSEQTLPPAMGGGTMTSELEWFE